MLAKVKRRKLDFKHFRGNWKKNLKKKEDLKVSAFLFNGQVQAKHLAHNLA